MNLADIQTGMVIVWLFIMIGIFLFIKLNRYYKIKKYEVIEEINTQLFPKKDLPVIKSIKITKDISIELYDLKRLDDGKIDRESYVYLKLSQIINKNTTIGFEGEGTDLEMNIDLIDFREEENKFLYMDIIEMLSSFNISNFLFKGDELFKLYNIEDGVVEEIKDHVDEIIHEVFIDVVDRYSKTTDSPEFAKLLSDIIL